MSPRVANRFVDQAPGGRGTYVWPLNHDEEEGVEARRNIDHGAPTAGTGLVRQQGASSPILIKLAGNILSRAQHVEFLAWWALCEDQTIEWWDYAGNKYEVLITFYTAPRQRLVHNPRGGTDVATEAPLNKWRYQLEMEVIRVIDGDYEAISP